MRSGFGNQMIMRVAISSLPFTHELVELHLAAVGETRAPCSAIQFSHGRGGAEAERWQLCGELCWDNRSTNTDLTFGGHAR